MLNYKSDLDMKYKYTLFLLFMVNFFLTTKGIAQNTSFSVEGTIHDREAYEIVLEGVSVVLLIDGERTNRGTVSDQDGEFSIVVPQGASLEFLYLGYKPITKEITKSTNDLEIFMKTDASELDETVITNYQEKSREEVTGSAVVIEGKELQDIPVDNVMELLQGRVPGLNIQNNNGTPGMMGQVVIRGVSTINVQGEGDQALLTPTPPLFVIDGIPLEDPSSYEYGFDQAGPGISPLSLIPPEDIKDITVLKDAQATSLYGSAGAYGVILIRTKRGDSEVPIISYSSSFFVNTPPQLRDVIVGRDERMNRINQIIAYDTSATGARGLNLINRNEMLADSLNPYYNNATDWQALFYRTTYNQSHNINASGGDQEFNYKINAGYQDSKGIIANTGFTRYTLDMNMGYRPTNKFNLRANINTSLGENSKGSGNALAQTGIADAGNTSSLYPSPSLYSASNETLGAMSIINENKTISVRANLNIGYELFPTVRLNSAMGYTYNTGTEDTFYPGLLENDMARIFAYNSTTESLYNRSNINYSQSFGNHNISASVFGEVNFRKGKSNSITQAGLPNDQIWGPIGYSQRLSSGSADTGQESRSVSFSSSLSYNFTQRYVADFTYRLSGGSTQGPDVPWTKSPSVGLRWNIHREAFFDAIDHIMSFASIRASWGKSIVPSGDIYDIYGRYNVDPLGYNNQRSISLELADMPNTSLIPSTNTSWNMGLNMSFLDGKYGLSFDTYYRQTDHILRRKEIANHNAFLGVNTNETSMVNYGYEMAINAHLLPPTSKWQWSVNINGALNQDVLAKLPDGARQLFTGGTEGGDVADQLIVNRLGGNSLSNYLFHYAGVYNNDLDVPVDPLTGLRYRNGGTVSEGRYFRAGDPIWTDINGDYILDDNDRVIVGNSQPRFVGGLSTNLRYGPFSVRTSISITWRRDILNNAIAERFRSFENPESETALVPINMYNFWTRENIDTDEYPNPYHYTRYELYTPFRTDQTLFQEDGSYLKINNVSLSYNLNRDLTESFGISSARINGSINNIYTFSKYSGPNPESVSGLGRDSSGGYPNSRSFSIGLNVQF